MRSIQSKSNYENNAFPNNAKPFTSANLMTEHPLLSHDSTSYSSNNSNKAIQNAELFNGSPEYLQKLDNPINLRKHISFSNSPQENHAEFVQYSPKFYDPLTQTASFQTFRNITETPKTSVFTMEQKQFPRKVERPLLQLEIQISEDRVAILDFYENEDYHQAAASFCAENKLPEDFIPIVEQTIKQALKKAFKKKKRNQHESPKDRDSHPEETKRRSNRASAEKPVLILTLEIEGKAENVKVYRGQDPSAIAEKFCAQHNLLPEAKYYLVKTIEHKLSKLQRQEERRKQSADMNDFDEQEERNTHPPRYIRNADSSEDGRKLNDAPAKEARGMSLKDNAHTLVSPIMETIPENEHSEFELTKSEIRERGQKEEQPIEPTASDPESNYEKWQKLIQQKQHEKQEKDGKYTKQKTKGASKLKDEIEGKANLIFHRYQSLTPKEMKESSQSGRYGPQIFNKLYYQGMRSKRKQAELQREREMNLLNDKNLTFHPKISDFARSMSAKRSSSADIPLYEDAETIKRKQMKRLLAQELALRELCPFKPTIPELPENMGYTTTRSKSPTIETRLYSTIGEFKRRRREELDSLFDEIHPFKPTLNEKTIELARKKEEREAELKKKGIEINKSECPKGIAAGSTNSQTIRENDRKLKPLQKLFYILQDEKGILSLKNLTKSTGLHPKSRNIILQIFERSNQTFTYEQFVSELSKRNLADELIQFLVTFPEINKSEKRSTPQNETSSSKVLTQQMTPRGTKTSELSIVMAHFPKIDVFLKRFNDLSNSNIIEAQLSKRTVESNSPKKTLNQTNSEPLKLTRHYKKLLLESHENSEIQ